MFAIIGLGNPGAKYETTRHNAGFWAIDKIAGVHNLASWKEKSGSLYLKDKVFGSDCILLKPQKYMNLSGEAAAGLIKFFQIDLGNIIVVHDELDLAPGAIRIRRGGGSGGHNGVEDCIRHFGSADFVRIRIGIGRPESLANQSVDGAAAKGRVSDWVLSSAKGEDGELLKLGVDRAVQGVEVLLKEGLLAAQNSFNRH